MWQKIKNVFWDFIDIFPAILTICFAALLVWESQKKSYSVTELLLWLIVIVGLLAISELIERLGLLMRIEKFSHETWNVNVPKISVYPSRIDAMSDIKKILNNEKREISIIAGSLGGTTRLVPDLSSLLSKANKNNIRIRILISHPQYMALRAKLEGKSGINQRERTIETLFGILEDPKISPENIRLYRFVPTCWALIAHEQRKLFLNPYTIGKRGEDTMSLMMDGNTYPEAYDNFINAHLEEPWCRNNLSISFNQFIKEHNSEIAKSIAVDFVEKFSENSGKPLIVAINGCPAMGKTNLADEISSYINGQEKISCTILETDGWMSKDREERLKNEKTGFDSNSYDIDGLSNAVIKLSSRQEAQKRTYNHTTGKRENGGILPAADIIIIDGLMSTHKSFRHLINTCYWMDCSPDSQKERRLKRDIEKRRYPPDVALQNWELHNKEWTKFESIYKPDNYIKMSSNRMGMLLL